MKANAIRLFEHVKLLQRGVELFQTQKGEVCDSLKNGFNGKNVRIGLLGATSAGKTTLIHRLLSDSAGKISSKPETACLVVHRFSKSESLRLAFCPDVSFGDESTAREFNQFLKDYKLAVSYEKRGLTRWQLKEGTTEETREYEREDIFSFFEQVNKFGKVFSKITWFHRQRRSDYNLMDLIDLYDLPGFGGKEEHDQTVKAIFDKEKFDILIYLIDTHRGIPSEEEMGYLKVIEECLHANPEMSFYWAYEKPSTEAIDLDEMAERIKDAVSEHELSKLADKARGLLDLTGPIDGDGDELQSRLLVNVLKPYFVDIGTEYRKHNDSVLRSTTKERDELFDKVFQQDTSWPLIEWVLDKLEAWAKQKMENGDAPSKKEARDFIQKLLLGGKPTQENDSSSASGEAVVGASSESEKTDEKAEPLTRPKFSIFRKREPNGKLPQVVQMNHGDKSSNERKEAIIDFKNRIEAGIDVILNGVVNFGKVSLTQVGYFKRTQYSRKKELHLLVFDLQMYWMLKDDGGVSGYIKRPLISSLYDNIDTEVADIEKFAFDDDEATD